MNEKNTTKDYWNNLYEVSEIDWDIGYPSPALANYLDQIENKEIKILIPGSGNSYEAEYLLSNSFGDITLIDIAPLLTEQLKLKFKGVLGTKIHIITGDFFEHEGRYDLILEQTFFSTLDPSLRESYTEKMCRLLNPAGKLVGVLFSRHFEESPPYGGSEKEYRRLFSKRFQVNVLELCYNSIDRRQGSEIFINLSKK